MRPIRITAALDLPKSNCEAATADPMKKIDALLLKMEVTDHTSLEEVVSISDLVALPQQNHVRNMVPRNSPMRARHIRAQQVRQGSSSFFWRSLKWERIINVCNRFLWYLSSKTKKPVEVNQIMQMHKDFNERRKSLSCLYIHSPQWSHIISERSSYPS